MEKLFELSCQDQTLNPQVGTFTDVSQTTGTFTLEDGEYYLTNADTKGFYAYKPVAMQSGIVDDSKVIIEFDLKVTTASANTHTIIGTYTGVDGNGIPTGDKITLQYNAGDIELALGSGTTATLIESADVVVDQWYHFRIDCMLAALFESTYKVMIDGILITTVTGATTDYELGIISVLGTDLHACDECGIKNITFVTETNMYVGRTALDQALKDVKNYVDSSGSGSYIPLAGTNALAGSIIPDTDNSYDFGSSTKAFKNFYSHCIKTNDFESLGGTAGLFLSTDSGVPVFRPWASYNGKILLGAATARWKEIWCTQGSINSSSDRRLKQQIDIIDDKLLDAWENVEPAQYKFNDAVETKGKNARYHMGYVSQDIQSALDKSGINASDYGFFLYDAWDEQQEVSHEETYTEEVETKSGEKQTVTKTRKVIDQPYKAKGDSYGLRYTECLVVECKYLRRCIARLTARIEQLEKGNNVK